MWLARLRRRPGSLNAMSMAHEVPDYQSPSLRPWAFRQRPKVSKQARVQVPAQR